MKSRKIKQYAREAIRNMRTYDDCQDEYIKAWSTTVLNECKTLLLLIKSKKFLSRIKNKIR